MACKVRQIICKDLGMLQSHQRRLNPGEPGTKGLLKKYGERLVCVRYKYDITRKERIKTIELVVERASWKPDGRSMPANKIVAIRIGYDELELRRKVKTVGARWDIEKKVWKMPYKNVQILGLEERIVSGFME